MFVDALSVCCDYYGWYVDLKERCSLIISLLIYLYQRALFFIGILKLSPCEFLL